MKLPLLLLSMTLSAASVSAQDLESLHTKTAAKDALALAFKTDPELNDAANLSNDEQQISTGEVTGSAPSLGLKLKNAVPDELKPARMGQVYKLNWKVDAPVTGVGMAWSLYAFTKIYSKEASTVAEMEALDEKNVPGIDRWAAGMENKKIDDFSNNLFYGSLLFPAFLFIVKDIRKDAAMISFLYLETFAITGLLYTGSTYFIDRYRPEAYRNHIPQSDKTSGNYRNAFFAGHPALVGTASFFAAKVYADYHPYSKGKYYVYGGAALATAGMIYMRHIAGKHFPTDLLVGTLVGVVVPHAVLHFHKKAANKDRAWNLSPSIDPFYSGGYGHTFNYHFK